MPASVQSDLPDSYGGVSAVGASMQTSESLVRRPGISTYILSVISVSAGVLVSVVGIRAASDPVFSDPGLAIRYIWPAGMLGIALTLICMGLTMAARRTVFDAGGIHSRGLIRRVDLPWPDTRTAFVVDVHEYSRDISSSAGSVRRRREVTLRVQVMTSERAVTLAMPRILSAAAENKLVLRSRLEADLDGIWAWALARGYAREWEPRAGLPWAADSAMVPADPALLNQEPLVIDGGCLTITREGLAWTEVRHARRLAWPPSRSCVFVYSSRHAGRTVATVRVLTPEGCTLVVPGLRWRSKDDRQALLPAATVAQSIWQWGVSRGAARDDGGYYTAVDADTERSRVDTARRIAYLLAHPRESR